jgi:hypothetical protein
LGAILVGFIKHLKVFSAAIGFFVPGQRRLPFGKYVGTSREYYSCFSAMLALCLQEHKNEHIAPIMFPPFSLDPIGFGVVGPMGPFFAPSHFSSHGKE